MNTRVCARAHAHLSDELHVVPRRDVEALFLGYILYVKHHRGHEAARGVLLPLDAIAGTAAPTSGFLYAGDDRMPAEMCVLHDACAMHVPKAEPDAAGARQYHCSVSFILFILHANR